MPSTAEALQFNDSITQTPAVAPDLHVIPGSLDQAEATPPQGALSVVPDFAGQALPDSAPAFISADTVPELFIKRRKAERVAIRTLAQNSHLLHNGRGDKVPTPVDALGTVRQVIEKKRKFGENSPEYQEGFEGLILDDERLIGEAKSKNRPEYFGRTKRRFRPATQEYFAHGLSISSMVNNGLSPLADPEEQGRRVKEVVEEDGTYVPIGSMIARLGLKRMVELLPIPVEQKLPKVSVEVTTISECADYAARDYKINPKGPHAGYRPAMEGLAIRRAYFEDDSGDREEDQVIIAGKYINHGIIREVLADEGVIDKGQKMTKTEVLGTQLISVNSGGLMGFVQKLDQKASAKHGVNLFMGVEVPTDHPKDYSKFMEEAEERRKELAPMPVQLAEFQVGLEEKGINSQVAEGLIQGFLKDKLLKIAKSNPELAEAMFDQDTAQGFAKVARLEAAGRSEEAHQLQLMVERNAPAVDYCGGGGGSSAMSEAQASGFSINSRGSKGTDHFGSLEFVCSNGHTNTREPNELIDKCQHAGCKAKVKC